MLWANSSFTTEICNTKKPNSKCQKELIHSSWNTNRKTNLGRWNIQEITKVDILPRELKTLWHGYYSILWSAYVHKFIYCLWSGYIYYPQVYVLLIVWIFTLCWMFVTRAREKRFCRVEHR